MIGFDPRVMSIGPKTGRWIDRADWLYQCAQRSGDEAFISAARLALQQFVEAKELRRCYESCARNRDRTNPITHLRAAASREHRKGVKAYHAARERGLVLTAAAKGEE